MISLLAQLGLFLAQQYYLENQLAQQQIPIGAHLAQPKHEFHTGWTCFLPQGHDFTLEYIGRGRVFFYQTPEMLTSNIFFCEDMQAWGLKMFEYQMHKLSQTVRARRTPQLSGLVSGRSHVQFSMSSLASPDDWVVETIVRLRSITSAKIAPYHPAE